MTIVARASAAGAAATTILRISGAAALASIARIFSAHTGSAASNAAGSFELLAVPTSSVVEGALVVASVAAPIPVMLHVFRAPRSYTGLDLIEIHMPGSPALVEAVLDALLAMPDVAAARPGEFTRRAFENGKLDLAGVEAVATLIAAEGESERRAALAALDGGLSRRVARLRDELLDVLALIEAELDFVEEEIDLQPDAEVLLAIERVWLALERICGSVAARDAHAGAALVMLLGVPNAGKSSLFNALLGEEAAVVTEEAGTTRDRNERVLEIEGQRIRLADVAGLAAPRTRVEARAQELIAEVQREAECLIVVSASAELPEEIEKGIADLAPTRVIRVQSKADLGQPCPSGWLATSAVTKAGIAELRQRILLATRVTDPTGGGALAGAQTRSMVTTAMAALERARTALPSGRELFAEEVRTAIDSLGELLGLRVTEEVLDRIFARFCIGK